MRLNIIILFTTLSIQLLAQPCRHALTTAWLDSVDIIVTAEYTDMGYNDNFHLFGTKDVFLGNPAYTILIDTVSTGITFEDGKEYLLYARSIDNIQRYAIDSCTRSALVSEAADDIQFLKETIPCPGKRESTGPCMRQSILVCGCDDKTYNNPCEARKAGITRYRFGACGR